MTDRTSNERLQEAEALIAMLSNDMDQHDFTRGYLPHWRPRLRAFLEGRPATYDPKDAPPRPSETEAEPAKGVAQQMRAALRKIAYEPFGDPEASDRTILDGIEQLAKETLALTDGPLPVFDDMETAAYAFFSTGQHRVAGNTDVQAVHQFAKWVDDGAPGYLRRRAVKSEAPLTISKAPQS